jgi:hypothetical protein
VENEPCVCCKRVAQELWGNKCWECAGRPNAYGAHVVPPAGERDPKCPHALPGAK